MDEKLPEDAWRPMLAEDGESSGPEVTEISFVSNMGARQKASHVMRFVATRRELPGELGIGLDDIPAKGGRPAYRVRCYFTNILAPDATAAERASGLKPREGEEIVRLADERCGQDAAVHSMLKNDLAAGILPSGRLGPNAAWLQATAIILKIVALVRMAAMGTEWRWARMKRLRAVWIHCVGMISRRGRPHDAGSAPRSPASSDSTQPPRRFASSAVARSGGLGDRPFRISPPSAALPGPAGAENQTRGPIQKSQCDPAGKNSHRSPY